VTTGIGFLRAAVCAAVLLWIAGPGGAMAQPASADEGMRIYKAANCAGCHKWSGNGGGSYGGAAANLRQTQLSLSEIEETIRCGRPMAGMPHFQPDAYSDGTCYGLKESDLADGKMPPGTSHPLRPDDIKAVAEYVATQIKGKGEPTFAQCQAFFGSETRVCDVYAKQGEGGGNQDAASSGAAGASPHQHMQVEAAGDANAPSK
jgi:mono/diheme cytochrome c family protein